MSLDVFGGFCQHPWDTTCQAVHDISRPTNQNIGKDGFQVSIDVSHFQPSEIRVKTIDDSIVVEAKHGDREDEHGSVERHLVRKYYLPRDYEMSAVHTDLSLDGILTIKVPLPKSITTEEQYVPITHTNIMANSSVNDSYKHYHQN